MSSRPAACDYATPRYLLVPLVYFCYAFTGYATAVFFLRGLTLMTDTSTSTNHTSRSSADRINQWVAVAAGVLGILVTVLSIFGFNVSNARDEAAGTAEGLQRELDDANRMVGSLRSDNTLLQRNLASANADNEKLQADIQSLAEQLKAAGETPSNALSSPEPSSAS